MDIVLSFIVMLIDSKHKRFAVNEVAVYTSKLY